MEIQREVGKIRCDSLPLWRRLCLGVAANAFLLPLQHLKHESELCCNPWFLVLFHEAIEGNTTLNMPTRVYSGVKAANFEVTCIGRWDP